MIKASRHLIKSVLRYDPLRETASIRKAVEASRIEGLPYCPANEGDFLYSLIRSNNFHSCLETGFYTGSTALYLSAAVFDRGGKVVSICLDDDEKVERGLRLLQTEGYTNCHRLIRKNSNIVLPQFFLSGSGLILF